MAMHLGNNGADDEIISTINTTPLVDVMLVLLIIFLITIPVVTTSVKVALPKETNAVRETKPDNLILSVDAQGKVFLFDTPMNNPADLQVRLKTFAAKQPQPEVQIRGDASSPFEAVGRVLYTVQQAGLSKIGFVTEPEASAP